MKRHDQKGAALILSLMVVMVLLIFGGIFVLNSVNEWNATASERRLAEAAVITDAGGEAGLAKIVELINTNMYQTVNGTTPQKVSSDAKSYVLSQDGLGFLAKYIKSGGTDLLTVNGNEAVFSQPWTSFAKGSYRFDISIREKSNPYQVMSDVWDFPFYFEIRAAGSTQAVSQKLLLAGDFTVRVKRENFAKFALFTDHHQMKPEDGGQYVWFTNKTSFAGPLQTNERYSYAFNPGAVFEDDVKQHLNLARFYNNGSPVLLASDNNSPRDVPTFHTSFTRGAPEVVLESSVQKSDLYSQARSTDGTPGNGIFVANNGSKLTGGIYVNGNSMIDMSVDAGDRAVYTITQGVTTKIVTVDIPSNQTSVQTVGGGTTVYEGLPDGVDDLGTIIYVDGNISSLKGTVQKDTELTVSAENDIVITDHVRYSQYTAAQGNPGETGYVPPSAEGAGNLLGLISWGEDVRVGSGAPDNIDIHSVVMARNGVFQVDGYDDTGRGSRGKATLLGGVITQFYGAFGLFNGSTGEQVSGYGRNFVYDSRTRYDKSPPYFPTMKAYIASTPDVTDKISYRAGEF